MVQFTAAPRYCGDLVYFPHHGTIHRGTTVMVQFTAAPQYCGDLVYFPHHGTIHRSTTVTWYIFPTMVQFTTALWHHGTVVTWYIFPTMVQFTAAPRYCGDLVYFPHHGTIHRSTSDWLMDPTHFDWLMVPTTANQVTGI